MVNELEPENPTPRASSWRMRWLHLGLARERLELSLAQGSLSVKLDGSERELVPEDIVLHAERDGTIVVVACGEGARLCESVEPQHSLWWRSWSRAAFRGRGSERLDREICHKARPVHVRAYHDVVPDEVAEAHLRFSVISCRKRRLGRYWGLIEPELSVPEVRTEAEARLVRAASRGSRLR